MNIPLSYTMQVYFLYKECSTEVTERNNLEVLYWKTTSVFAFVDNLELLIWKSV